MFYNKYNKKQKKGEFLHLFFVDIEFNQKLHHFVLKINKETILYTSKFSKHFVL